MNNYICEYIYENQEPREICVKALDKKGAKHAVKEHLKKYGYKVYLKNIRVCCIDTSAKHVNV